MFRREFISKTTSAAVLPFVLPTPAVDFGFAQKRALGIMLNTVEQPMQSDFRQTLFQLKDMGYDYVEGGFYGDSLENFTKVLKDSGLKSLGHGGALGEMQQDLQSYINTALALEQKYLVCYYPWTVANNEIDKEKSYRAAEHLNALGRKIKNSGLDFCWHPHSFELRRLEGNTCALDILMENTDPEYVSLQMDTYWMVRGGEDPAALLKKYPGRTRIMHLKDMAEDESNACVGTGSMTFEPIIKEMRLQNIHYWTVEQESKNTNMECAKIASKFLNTF